MGSSPSTAKSSYLNLPTLPPYSGHQIVYKHLVFIISLNLNPNMGFEERSQAINAANIDQYFPHMAAMYHQGYRMELFFSLPNSEKSSNTVGGMGGGIRQKTGKFQATFRKLLPEEEGQHWELQTDKSVLVTSTFSQWNSGKTWNSTTQSSSVTDTDNIRSKLNMITQRGGRLIAIEVSQMGGQQATMQQAGGAQFQQQNASMGMVPQMQVPVDIFYEVPGHPSSDQYTYQVVSCPMICTSFQGRQITLWSTTIDWESVMSQYLGTGWKLVEIFEDSSSVKTGTVGSFGNQQTKQNNCLWIFEKPVSRMHDNTPYYECTKVETQVTVSVSIGFGSCSATAQTDWDPLMDHYGSNGWQVVRILRTPDTKTSASFPPVVHQRYMMFLQRLIVGRVDVPGIAPPIPSKGSQGPFQGSSQSFPENNVGAGGSAPTTAPPSYESL